MLYMILLAILAVVIVNIAVSFAVLTVDQRFFVERYHPECAAPNYLRYIGFRGQDRTLMLVHLHDYEYVGTWEDSDSYWGWYPVISRKLLTKRWALCVMDMTTTV